MSLTSMLLAFAPAIAARFEKPEKPASFVCSRCGAKSFNPNDIRERYCGRCHAFAEQKARRARDHLRAELQRFNDLDDLLPLPLGGQQAAMQQHWQNAMAQQQMTQNAEGLLVWPEGWHCDCSPSRSRALGPGA